MHVAVNVHLAKLCLLLLSAVKINVLVNSQIWGISFAGLPRKLKHFVSEPRVVRDAGHWTQYRDCLAFVG